jgi:TRAP transporter 4TM/12TM fusion protein
VTGVAVAMSAFHLYTAGHAVMTAMVQRSVHLAFALVLIFLLYSRSGRAARTVAILDWVLVGLSLVGCLYVTWNWDALSEATRIANPTALDLSFGAVTTLLVLEATRRTAGPALPIVALCFIAYAFLGPWMPGALAHPGIPIDQFIGMNYLFTEGIFGAPLGVSATFVVIFIVFGAFLEESGGGRFFIDLACSAFGAVRGGPAKIAIVASGFFGMISGSAVANVVGSGTFTIPLMKRVGYSPPFAAAVEAVASTGGMIMPPVMGAAAFIMAEILGVSYLSICLAAAIPALLYFISLYTFIDLEAMKLGLRGIPDADRPDLRRVLAAGAHLLLPPVVLIYLLAVVQWSAMKAGFYAIVATIVVAMLRQGTRLTPGKLVAALRKGAIGTLQVAAVCACAGIVISVVSITGLGLTLSSILINLAQGYLPLALLLTMCASLLLGMGLPATPCYIILAVLAAPAIVELGVPRLSAHLFVFYFGCLSAITPPVAVAAYAAAAIAGSNPMRTGYVAWRLGLTAFIVPYMFVYGPPLLMLGAPLEILLATATAVVGVLLFAAGIQGYGLIAMAGLERWTTVGAALLLIKPGWKTDLVGLVVALSIGMIQLSRRRRQLGEAQGVVSRAGATP